MKRSLLLLPIFFFLCSISSPGFGQFSVVLADSFQTAGGRIDLSELFIRFGETEAVSAFEIVDYIDTEGLSFPAIHMNAVGEEAGVCCTYDNGSFLAHNCIDFEFPDVIARSGADTLWIEFDGIWEMANDKKGEGSKLIAYLMYDYPAGGPPADVYNDLSQDYYGKPAYQLWILNGSNRAFMTYGAGLNDEGSFIQLPAESPEYWLPGFTEKRLAEGEIDQQDPYPASDYGRVMDGSTVSEEYWMHYTWEITEDRLSLFWRKSSETEENNELLLFMETPENGDLTQINNAHGTIMTTLPPFYEWLNEMNAFRMFINKDAYFSNLKISKTGTPLSTYFMFAKKRVKVDESEGEAQLPVLITNPSTTEDARVEIALSGGDASLINGFSSGELVFSAGGSSSKSLELTISGDENEESDTLFFKLSGATGGTYATVYKQTEIELIIEDGPNSLQRKRSREINIYPNPAGNYLQIQMPDHENIEALVLYDLSGKALISMKEFRGKGIDISSLEPGYYLAKIQASHQIFRSVLIKL